MGRATGPAIVLLFLAGGAFAALGYRAWRLEGADAARRESDRIDRASAEVARRLPTIVADPALAVEAAWDVVDPLPAPSFSEDAALVLRQAAFLERRGGDPEGALRLLATRTTSGGPASSVAALRAARLAAVAGRREEAAALRAAALLAPDALADEDGVPVRLAAAFLDAADAEPSDAAAALERFLLAAGEGRRVSPVGVLGPDDLIIALAARAQAVATAGRAAEPALASAAARAAEGASFERALATRDAVVVGDALIRRTRGTDGTRRIERIALAALLAAAGASEADLDLRPHTDRAEVDAALVPLASPLEGAVLVARSDVPRVAPVPWNLVLGFAVYLLGSVLAVLAIHRAVRAARSQADFVAAVSHELKTPIASVRAMAELLEGEAGREPEVARRYAERIGWEMQRLGASVRNVLDAARIERLGGIPVVPRVQDPAEVVREVADAARPGLERRGLAFQASVQPAAGPQALDAEAIRGVLANLLDNAAKHGGGGGEVRLVSGPEADGYRVTVLDRGPGVPLAERDRLFRRFFRGEAARVGAVPGVGLGLHVSRGAAEAHGGTLTLEAREGGGAAFVLRLPRSGRAVP